VSPAARACLSYARTPDAPPALPSAPESLPALPWEAGYQSERCALCARFRDEPDARCLCEAEPSDDEEMGERHASAFAEFAAWLDARGSL
jgi:hypothetical protein